VSALAIRAEGVGKRFRLGEARKRHNTLRDAIAAAASRTAGRMRSGGRSTAQSGSSPTHFWALSDVSFDVPQGEVLGIIGPNGAGKSTLLKILSRITEPTTGEVRVRGRVGSLLEVGTGFHTELTGRENIFLNGAILGMTGSEISRKFDEIVAFAGVERFIDTPVKHYSSGMYLRLGFAVAAHLEPEILVVDEVLAVGDADFQRKCLNKMDDVAREGRTVVFVSHNLGAIQRLCTRCMSLTSGRVERYGATREVVAAYLSSVGGSVSPQEWIDLRQLPRTGSRRATVRSLRFTGGTSERPEVLTPDSPLEVTMIIRSDQSQPVSSLAITLYDLSGTKLVNADVLSAGRHVQLEEGDTTVRFRIRELHLNPGTYILGLWIGDHTGQAIDSVPSAAHVEVADAPAAGFGTRPGSDGVVSCDFEFGVVDPGDDRNLATPDRAEGVPPESGGSETLKT
jgi:lipopolysaccharide transport system ATP-binding protein